MPDKLSEDKRDELFEMLDQGMSPSSIADELDVSEKTVYNYKDEFEERQEIQRRVSRNSGVSVDDVVGKADNIPGLGSQTASALEQALSMNEMVLNDPNELYRLVNQVTDLDSYWIDFLVKSVYPNMNAPSNPGGGRGQQVQYSQFGQQDQGGPQPSYPSPQGGQQGPQQGRQGYPPQGGQGYSQQAPQGAPQQGGQARDPRVDQLQDTVDQLSSLVRDMAEDDDDGGETEYIEIQKEDGSTLRLPADDPRVTELLVDDDDGDDMFDTLAKLKEAGLIMSPQQMQEMQADDNEESEMAEAIKHIGEQQAQAQQQMSQNFANAINQLRELEEEDEDIGLDDVEEIIEDKLTKDETERLRDEMDTRFNEVLDRVEKRQKYQPAEQDPEFLKADRELEFREQQLDMLNKNLQVLPKQVSESIRDGLVPALKELQHGGNPLWSAPGQQGRGEPAYVPEEAAQQGQRGGQQRQQQPRQRQQQSGGYPDRERTEQQQTEQQMGQENPDSTTEQDAQEVRDKLGLGNSGPEREVAE